MYNISIAHVNNIRKGTRWDSVEINTKEAITSDMATASSAIDTLTSIKAQI